ncbi:CoA ester lyase [Mesorhizobium sp. Z1-4]|uniref:HpcH/HpaI aldolase/citrate lyase family protein n=1 Tax=Mesorhizobium sp. Z1-4 TaxID=2448478 RepID=UPI000FDBC782|nr:CoA ester lyase [Mesorhizobium sp. Z1-4]
MTGFALSRPRRSVLYVPADNQKALAKIPTLDCDAVILDLEDAVAPEAKDDARETMRRFLRERRPENCDIVIRINALASEWGTEDLLAARAVRPDAILLPKVDGPRDVLDADAALDEMDAPAGLALWAMVETPKALFNLSATAELGRDPAARLACLVAGTNDLVKETGVLATPDRRYLVPWLLQMVAAARAAGIDALDGVMNDFRDAGAFENECVEGRNMGFDGKTLIHPSQIEVANRTFMPSASEIAAAEEVVAAFARPENAGKGVVAVGGRMVERLHLAQAERLLGKAGR